MTLVATTPEARRDAIQRGLENLVPIIAAAYKARDWEHFGFDTWAGYVASFGQLRLPRPDRHYLQYATALSNIEHARKCFMETFHQIGGDNNKEA